MKKKLVVFLNILFVLFSVGAILLDYYVEIETKVDFTIACTVCLTLLTLIFTVWFSYLIAVKQLFQKKYEKEKFKKYITEGQLIVFGDFIILFVCGVVVSLTLHTFFVTHIVYFVFCLIYFVCTAISLYVKIEKNEYGKLISESANDIIKKISASEDNQQLSKYLEELNALYNECFLKKDELACKEISTSYTRFLVEDIKTKNIKILQGKKEYVVKNIRILLSGLCGLVKNEDSDFADALNTQILFKLINIAKQFILCDDMDSAEIVVERYFDVLKTLSGRENLYCDKVYKCLATILTTAINESKNKVVTKVLSEARKIHFILQFEVGYASTIHICKLYVLNLLHCLENYHNCSEQYKCISDDFYKFVITREQAREAETAYFMLESLITDSAFTQNATVNTGFYDFVKKIVFIKRLYANSEIVRIISNYIDYIEKNEVVEFDKLICLKYDFACNSLFFMKDVPSYVLPSFSEAEMRDKLQSVNDNIYSNQMFDLANQCLSKNNINCLSIILSDLKNLLCQLEARDKDRQKVWLEVFFHLFYQASLNDNSLQVSIILKVFKDAIAEMDSQRNISNDLGNWIIENLSNLCLYRYRGNVDFVCRIVEYLKDLASTKESNLYFVNNNNTMDKIYKNVFYIGIDAVEKNQPLVIKRVSNVIGWALYESIVAGKTSLIKQLITDAISLFKLCLSNKIDFQTIVFVGTLFIIIGAYSKKNKKINVQRSIVEQLKKIDCMQYIDVSKQLRVANAEWDILGDNPRQAIYEFVKELY